MMWNTKLAIFSQDCKIIFPALYNFENRVGTKFFGKHFVIFSFFAIRRKSLFWSDFLKTVDTFSRLYLGPTSWLLWLRVLKI